MTQLRGRAVLLVLATAIIPACGGNGGGRVSSTPTPGLPSCVIPGPGNLTVSAKGGESTTGLGGDGGAVEVAATSGSDLKLLCGPYSVDVAFTPPEFTPYLGPNPRTFLTAGPATLTPTVDSGAILGDDGVTRATGLRVGPGVLLTITTNFPNLPALRTMAGIAFSHAIWIEGQVTTANQDLTAPGDAGSNNASALQLVGSNLLLTAAAAIVTTGRAGVSLLPDGGNGGDILARIQGVLVNKGTITATGADGFTTAGNGGKGGRVTFSSGTFLYSTGNVTTNGGTGMGPLTTGGAGGQIVMVGSVALNSLPAEHGGCFVRGTLSARGGDGTQFGGAGPSGPNQFFAGAFGVLLANQATPLGGRGVYDVVIDASGGDATDGGAGGDGATGDFAGVRLRAEGGTLRVKATITNRGGSGELGADGGSVLIQQLLGNGAGSPGAGTPDLEGGMAVAAAIDTGGGTGGSDGGNAGKVTFEQLLNGVPSGRNPMILAGYKLFETSGGDGEIGGGGAGALRILNHVHTDDSGLTAIGGILNQVELKALGGSGGTGGGIGGAVTLQTDSPSQLLQDRPDTDRSVTNAGVITTTGGGSGSGGAPGGAVTIYDHRAVVNFAAITTSGGDGATINGGKAGDITLQSERTICNSGPLTAIGGIGAGATGGDGGTIRVRNLTVLSLEPDSSVCNSAPLNASGGSGLTGGVGGTVSLYAHLSLMNSGPLFADGGPGSAGNGGNGGVVSLSSDAELSNEAAAFARGGAGTGGNGGTGGFLFFVADRTAHHGNLTATGGNGTATGGVGGFIQVYSATPPSVKTGTFSVAPGTGGAPAAGAVDVDGIGQPLIGGVITF